MHGAPETWLEVDLDALSHNVAHIRRLLDPKVAIIAALKGNAYGFGLIPVTLELERTGISWVAVGRFDHAVAVRQSGFAGDILVFGCSVALPAPLIEEFRLIPTLYDLAQAKALADAAATTMEVAVKVDTGLGRLGVTVDQAVDFIRHVQALPGLGVALVYTHLGDPHQSSNSVAQRQVERFAALAGWLQQEYPSIRALQAAASSGMVVFPEARFNAVCIGRMVFGFSTLPEHYPRLPPLRPVFRALKTRLIQVKNVTSGRFGPTRNLVEMDVPRRVGIVPCGVSDGLPPHHAAVGRASIRRQVVPFVGKTSLEHMILDLQAVPDARPGDEVTLIDGVGTGPVGLQQVAAAWNVSPDQVAVMLSSDVPRRYWRAGRLSDASLHIATPLTGGSIHA